ncbi:MAG: integrin [Sandaracinaceae bacterium]|nr:integrin [Sandaracinaceae bacterium]
MNTRCWNFTTLTMAALAAFLAGGCGGDPAASLDSGVPVDSAIATDASRLDAGVFEDAGRADMALIDAAELDAGLDAGSDAGPAPNQQAYVKASNTDVSDSFGYTVALSADGNTLAVGAPNEDSNATGVGGAEADDTAGSSGAVYVFTRTGETWTQQAYIKASNAGTGDHFGSKVSLSADGNTLAIGAPDEDSNATGVGGNQTDNSAGFAGAVYVFARAAGTWTQDAYVKASNTAGQDFFGTAVSLSADGNTLAVGAYGEDSNATGIGGNQADNSATLAGAIYVFSREEGVWSQEAYVKASNTDAEDMFGTIVSLSADGNTLAVGAQDEDSGATGIGGNQADESTGGAGAVYVFSRAASVWTQTAYIKASNSEGADYFSGGLSLSADGNTLAVGAYGEDSNARGIGGNQADNSAEESGAVYLFVHAGSVWTQQAYVKASNTDAGDFFGGRVSLSADGSALAVGAVYEASIATGVGGNQADNSARDAGAIYLFTREAGSWAQRAYVKASNTEALDGFGGGMMLSSDGSTLAAGASTEDSNAIGIGGDQADNSADGAGATYIFAVP